MHCEPLALLVPLVLLVMQLLLVVLVLLALLVLLVLLVLLALLVLVLALVLVPVLSASTGTRDQVHTKRECSPFNGREEHCNPYEAALDSISGSVCHYGLQIRREH